MLEDKALKLCQEVTPNTAEGKEMQYAAVWTEDGSQIVQIGMEPKRLLKLMQEKTLEHVVSTFPFDFSGYLHVLDLESNEIVATTSSKLLGRNFSEKFDSHSETFNEKIEDTHYTYNGKRYCVYVEKFKGYLLIRTYLSSFPLKETLVSTAMLLVYIGVVAIVVLGIIGWYVRKRVSDNLTHIVDELKKIESGDLENITIQTGIIEFDKLIFYINQLLKTIRLSWTKMSNVVDKSGLPIGIFEYSHFYKKYLINERLLEILGIQEKEASEAQADLVQKILLDIEKHQVNEEEVIYEYSRQNERIYLRMEKIVDELSVTYYVTDVSQWWNEVSDLKKESSRDALTLLYNRRGFHEKMEAIFLRSQELGHAVLVMIDADGLKTINDVYGHLIGDEYLKRIGKMFEMTSEEHMVSARLGGDEFVVFFYGYSTREELEYELEQLKAKRGERLFNEKEKINATIEFSAGYAFYQEDGQDYHALMQVADQRMYMEKSSRKQQLQNSR